MNESQPSLDDLALFLDLAAAGSLAETARRRSMPLPTLSRRMTKLEQMTGRALFLRGRAGYALSGDGRALAAELHDLPELRQRVSAWMQTDHGPVAVRITAGFWTAHHLAMRLAPDRAGRWLPAFVASNAPLDLAGREADIGIRNRPPTSARLARQRLRRIDYVVYASDPAVTGYVALPAGPGLAASQRWLHDTCGDRIVTTATDPRLCLDLALAGFGQVVLPTFAGDATAGLTRMSPPIAPLSHDEWLVSHHASRHDPPIRAALNAIADALCPD
ncbi:LysR family transcriptional regulator [Salipiger aestuarii]|uniref:LysR family transcriptional regulator n=1 Tax=Salipiger aestuarii TaxID=568098 RepID=UPI00123C767E|nr:LysR family transcriptional regulator [Salipiger aestuarii]KAA8610076.1 LysR family transcriptional regulator [Salipiger aestuarii]